MLIKIIVVIVIIALLFVMGLTMVMMIKPDLITQITHQKNNKNNNEKNESYQKMENIGDTKSFLSDLEFFDYAFGLGNHTYRAIIECSSVNYDFMNPDEQAVVETAYSRFLNSLNFPIYIYLQTREYDSETMMERLHANIEQSVRKFPSIQEYATMYEKNMQHLPEYISNTKVRKKYIIVPFDNTDLSDMSALSNEELEEFALGELMLRTNIVCSNISACGITPTICDKEDLAEIIYSYYHRDYYKIARDIVIGKYTTIAVNGKAPAKDSITQILGEAENRFKALSFGASPQEVKLYDYLVSCIEDLKDIPKTDNLDLFLQSVDDMFGESSNNTDLQVTDEIEIDLSGMEDEE